MQLGARQLQQITDVLHALDAQPPHPKENRRQRARANLRVALVVSLLEAPAAPQIKLYTRNISTTGLGFLCQRPFHRGELAAVHLALGQPTDKLVLGRVIFCRYVRMGMYETGLLFEEACAHTNPLRIPITWLKRANPRAYEEQSPMLSESMAPLVL